MRFTFSILAFVLCGALWGQNPVVQTCYTTDPAPFVFGDRLYLLTGHDEARADFFWMNDWRMYSTCDMVNWTDHGVPLAQCDFTWADDRSWASQIVPYGGRFYFYMCAHSRLSGGMAIGVAVADAPTGPYHDALGRPLFDNGSWDNIDPTVFIDDDGQAYLGWGNPKYYSAKLNKDMTSLAGAVQCDSTITRYTEGPWLTKRDGRYILMYAAGGVPESIAYSVSDHPQGPWTYVGDIMAQDDKTLSFTNHAGLASYKGHDYFFYHTGWLPGGGGFGRSVCAEEYTWTSGRFPLIAPTREGLTPVATFSPFSRVEGETMAYSHNVSTDCNATSVFLSNTYEGSWTKLRAVDFGHVREPRQLTLRAASALQGGTLELRLDSVGGALVARCAVPRTGGFEAFETFHAPVSALPEGVHDLYLVFHGLKGQRLMSLDYWLLEPAHDTYAARNPLFWADYPDPDLIRVGNYYYLVTTTMHLMPGGPVMRSSDLVHWETVSYLFPRLDDQPAYSLTGGDTKYGQGQWATSLRYHKGTFYALFVTNGVPGSWIYATDDPARGWHLHAHLKGFYHDPSLFFDDDDRAYIFSGSGSVDITELEADLSREKEGGFRRHLELHDADDDGLLEGSRVIKKDGYYYLIMISWPHSGRHQIAFRSRSLDGVWEKREILKDNFDQFGNVGQGTIVDCPDGTWRGLIFQDRGGVGRILTLSPCRWVDGWPLIGDEEGHVTPCALRSTATLDRQWNHNPDTTAYTWLQDGRLELRTQRVVDNLFIAPNTLTWRMWGPTDCDTVCLDISRMRPGDRAGFAAFNSDAALLTVAQEGGERSLVLTEESVVLSRTKHVDDVKRTEKARVALGRAQRVWLRIEADFNRGQDLARFAYSLDGTHFEPVGGAFKMRFDFMRFFMGTRYAVFNYATQKAGGRVRVTL